MDMLGKDIYMHTCTEGMGVLCIHGSYLNIFGIIRT